MCKQICKLKEEHFKRVSNQKSRHSPDWLCTLADCTKLLCWPKLRQVTDTSAMSSMICKSKFKVFFTKTTDDDFPFCSFFIFIFSRFLMSCCRLQRMNFIVEAKKDNFRGDLHCRRQKFTLVFKSPCDHRSTCLNIGLIIIVNLLSEKI